MTLAPSALRYPIFIPSKGRWTAQRAMTAACLNAERIPFRLVVEDQEQDFYAAIWGADRILVLPFSNTGTVMHARNWIKEFAESEGHERHWQLDDNIKAFHRVHLKKRPVCSAHLCLSSVEEFTDRYENIAIAGMNYVMFAVGSSKPFVVNCHVYSCSLVLNSIPHRWRGRYNEDTDLCLQVLSDGWCTVLFNAFLVQKIATMVMKGGNTDAIYRGDGRLKMARALERMWPGVVETKRRFQRPQHVIKNAWRKFDTPLRRKADLDLSSLPACDEYGMALVQKAEVRSDRLRSLMADNEAHRAEQAR